MRFIIDGRESSLDDLADLTQQDLMDMVKQAGMGVQTWVRRIAQIPRLALADDGQTVIVLSETDAKANPDRVDPDLMTESAPHLQAFLIMVWLGRRRAGEPKLRYEESTALPWRSMQMLPDPEPAPLLEETVEDPTQPSASDPVSDGDAAATSTLYSPV